MIFAFMILPFMILACVLFLFLRPMILVGSEPVWLPTYASAYISFACFVLCVNFESYCFCFAPDVTSREKGEGRLDFWM